MDGPAPVTAASSVLERLPLSRWHWRLVVLVGIGTFFDLYEVFLGGVLAPVLAKEFGLGTVGKSMKGVSAPSRIYSRGLAVVVTRWVAGSDARTRSPC